MTNFSIPVSNMLEKSRTLAVSVAINISMQLCFVSVHGPRETYFVDELRNKLLFSQAKGQSVSSVGRTSGQVGPTRSLRVSSFHGFAV
jgi:hypothetical protein